MKSEFNFPGDQASDPASSKRTAFLTEISLSGYPFAKIKVMYDKVRFCFLSFGVWLPRGVSSWEENLPQFFELAIFIRQI